VPRRALDGRVEELAREIATGAPLTARASKHGIRTVMQHLAVDRLAEGQGVSEFDALAAEAFASEDLKEGVRAFRERREPRFEGH
jgi:enoyl-CoA hydratase/carnithine racemase